MLILAPGSCVRIDGVIIATIDTVKIYRGMEVYYSVGWWQAKGEYKTLDLHSSQVQSTDHRDERQVGFA